MKKTKTIKTMQLIYYPAPILFQQCKPALNSGRGQRRKDRLDLANVMWNIMHKNHGVGLSTPQVNCSHRMFVWNHIGGQIYNQAIWNPVLSCVNGCKESIEGCLSLPKVSVTIQRATSSILSGTGLNDLPVRFIGDAMTTRIWQHEIDHLDGKLIIDNMSSQEKIANQDAIRTLLKNTIA